jgi:hypothetical protein
MRERGQATQVGSGDPSAWHDGEIGGQVTADGVGKDMMASARPPGLEGATMSSSVTRSKGHAMRRRTRKGVRLGICLALRG